MSTTQRRRGQSLHLDLPDGQKDDLPPVAAAFLLSFDAKAGYTIAWQRSIPGLELRESVEFKSLPSGLHKVEEDLIYFTHDQEYAGISAFINKPSGESDRNAVMLAVGVLVPSHGRLGKSWKHAKGLKELAATLSIDYKNTQPLEEFWIAHNLHEPQSQGGAHFADSSSIDNAKRNRPRSSINGNFQRRNRAVSGASGLAPSGQMLSSYHPAHSLAIFLDTFGPLIFPLYKAALLRKRILLVGSPPVELACNFVYDISLLSGLPAAVSDLLPLDPLPAILRPLFSVGLHDITSLSRGSPSSSADDEGYGWVACTTDDILSQKVQLYDYLVHIPPAPTSEAKQKVWPRVLDARGKEIKATQRDFRRYRTLRRGLRQFADPWTPRAPSGDPSRSLALLTQDNYDSDMASNLEANLSETPSWPALLFRGFWWWASAGEQRTALDEEEEFDAALFREIDGYGDGSPTRPMSTRESPGRLPGVERGFDKGPNGPEIALVVYFHRLTNSILKTLSDIVDDIEDNPETSTNKFPPSEAAESRETDQLLSEQDAEHRGPIVIEVEDISRIVDLWSESDRAFVKELVAFYWGREADVRGGRVECCGVQIC
ncbi:MAG: hypothetical protein Q9217_003006 [Psora testacea]